ncbi:hydrogenase maturation nickel metallochaperone HypA [Candidatus Bipolaricaulota bacterium]|nr:hydrogenase maturation nickel metallochaperone HypA [Candidatus Bipolaricaulota bacterium]
MHEYSIAEELIDTLLRQVDEETLSNANSVHLEIGEIRMVSRDALSQAFKIVTEDTLLEGAGLEFEEVPLLVGCEKCDFEGKVDYEDDFSLHFSVPVLSCPECGSSVEIIEGNELTVRTLTVSSSDSDD